MAFPEKELRHLWEKFRNDPHRYEKIADYFGWTIQQAYIATESIAKADMKRRGLIHGN